MQGSHTNGRFTGTLFHNQLDEPVEGLAARSDAFHSLHAAIFDSKNGLEIECCSKEALRAADAAAAMQEFKGLHGEINAYMLAGFLHQGFAIRQGGPVYGSSGSPIFRCLPTFNAGKLLGVEVTAPTRIIGVFIRLSNDKDGLKFADRLRVDPKDMAWGIGGKQFYPYLLDYAKQHPCEALR